MSEISAVSHFKHCFVTFSYIFKVQNETQPTISNLPSFIPLFIQSHSFYANEWIGKLY